MTDRTVKVHLKGDISDFNRKMLGAAATMKAFTKEMDTGTDRATMFTQSALAFGPALVPIGAAAVPAISGLTNQLAFAAAGAGVTALAFSGIGDALKSVNDYQLEPTTANFEKLQETMRELGPAGREFVMFLQQIRPELQQLQDAAQEGLLPGAEAGIRELMVLMPQAERIVTEIASSIGDLIAEGGDNLNDPRWREFFAFLEAEARPTLMDMGRTLGNFAEGFANLWMAFDPLSDNFSASFLQMSRDFAAWTDGLDETEGFQEFLDYIERTGPKVWDTLGALGNALLQVVEAAAPIGEASLPIIKAVADVLALIADSPAGPVLIGAAAGISALSRAVALYNVANGAAMTTMINKLGGKGAALRATAAGVGLVGLSMTDLDEKMGLSNTAMLATAGLIAGPWGAAIGGGVGLVMDFASANDDAAESIKELTSQVAAAGTNDLAGQHDAWMLAMAKAGDDPGLNKLADKLGDVYYRNIDLSRAAEDAAMQEAGFGLSATIATEATRKQILALLDNVDAHKMLANELLAQSNAEVRYEQAIDAATAAAKENGRTLDINTKAGQNNQLALNALVGAWNDLPDAAQTADGAFERARDSIIKTRMAMGKGREEAEAYADSIMDIPPTRTTEIRVRGVKEAKAAAQAVIDAFNRISPFKDIRIRTYGDDVGNLSRAPKKRAMGGLVGRYDYGLAAGGFMPDMSKKGAA